MFLIAFLRNCFLFYLFWFKTAFVMLKISMNKLTPKMKWNIQTNVFFWFSSKNDPTWDISYTIAKACTLTTERFHLRILWLSVNDFGCKVVRLEYKFSKLSSFTSEKSKNHHISRKSGCGWNWLTYLFVALPIIKSHHIWIVIAWDFQFFFHSEFSGKKKWERKNKFK